MERLFLRQATGKVFCKTSRRLGNFYADNKSFDGKNSKSVHSHWVMSVFIGFECTISVYVDFGLVCQQKFHDVEASGLCAVVQCRVALDGLAVDVGLDGYQELGDLVVALVAGDHQTRVPVTVRHFDV